MPMTPEEEKYELCVHDLSELLQKTSAVFQGIERRQTRLTGFTSSQSFLLMTLFHDGPLSMGELATRMDWEKSTLSRIALVMQRDGLVESVRDTGDRRVIRLSLTGKGRDSWQQIREKQRDCYVSIISALPRGHVREVMNNARSLFDALLSSLNQNRKD